MTFLCVCVHSVENRRLFKTPRTLHKNSGQIIIVLVFFISRVHFSILDLVARKINKIGVFKNTNIEMLEIIVLRTLEHFSKRANSNEQYGSSRCQFMSWHIDNSTGFYAPFPTHSLRFFNSIINFYLHTVSMTRTCARAYQK